MNERGFTFCCAGAELIGIVSQPKAGANTGVLILVGGPQYRVGSHRQFLLLARRLAGEGVSVMRFDRRGMGDSTGELQPIENTTPDIAAAIDAFQASSPRVERVVLWGLCDGASASLLYVHATRDPRVAGIVLVNPFIHSEAAFARTQLKHEYLQRVKQRDFWYKLALGKVNVGRAIREVVATLASARRRARVDSPPSEDRLAIGYQEQMTAALAEFDEPILLILGGADFTAAAFLEYFSSNPKRAALLERKNVCRRDLPRADHTFSDIASSRDVEEITVDWLKEIFRKSAGHEAAKRSSLAVKMFAVLLAFVPIPEA